MKQLDTEYKNLIAMDIPDLWDRIEAGVDEYEAKKKETKQFEEVTAKADENIVEIKKDRKISKKTIITIGKVLGAAACLLIVVNAFAIFRTSKNETASVAENGIAFAPADESPSAASDYYADDACAEAAAEETYYEDEACESAEEIPSEPITGFGFTSDSFIFKVKPLTDKEEDIEAARGERTETISNDAQAGEAEVINEVKEKDMDFIAYTWKCDEAEAENIANVLGANGVENIIYCEDAVIDDNLMAIWSEDEQLCEYDIAELSVKCIVTENDDVYYVFADVSDGIEIVAIAKGNM